MHTIFSLIARFLTPAQAPGHRLARQLLEGAQASAGRDPQQAQELRAAARAYLSVVR